MSKVTSERVMNLLIALLTTSRFLTKQELRELIPGYREVKSFERTFERDKAALRELGISIATGSNNPDSDEESGYRIYRSEIELPQLTFDRDELIALGLASHVWQSSVGAQAASHALQRLKAAGAEPELGRLQTIQVRIPVAEPDFDVVHEALFTQRVIEFDYDGKLRRLHPWRLSQRRGLWHVLGFDPDRGAERSFKLSRMREARLVGRAQAYEIPADMGNWEYSRESASAIVAVRDAPVLLAGANPISWPEPLPEGFRSYEITRLHEAMIVSDVCAVGEEAILLAPSRTRRAVIERLRAAAGIGREES